MPDYGVVIQVQLDIKARNQEQAEERAKAIATYIREHQHLTNYRWWPKDLFPCVGAVAEMPK